MKNNQKSYGNLIKNGIFTQLQLLGIQLFGVYKKTTYLCQQILDESRIRRITELSHVVQERAEGPKAPSPGHRPGDNGNQQGALKGQKLCILPSILKLLPLQGDKFVSIITQGDALG